MYVHGNFQGQGIGSALLHSILLDINRQDHKISVSVFQTNPFKEFYLKNNFVKIEEEKIDLGDFDMIGDIYIRSTELDYINPA